MKRFLFVAGGSIGHIAPCIAVWRAVRDIDLSAKAHFVCSLRPEDGQFLKEEGVTWTAIGGRRVRLWTLPIMMIHSWKLLSSVKPDVIFTKGGGMTAPIALAGWMRGIPIVVHESDAVSGRATRCISRFATVSINGCTAGNPLRPGIHHGSRERGLELTGLSGKRPIFLVTGGSQGAQVFNDAIVRHIDDLLRVVDIMHITGEGKSGMEERKAGYWKSTFIHEDLKHLYAAADIALSRGGSGTIGELAANGIPAILVPLEGLAQDHQVKNAEVAALSGGCMLLRQARLESDLVSTVRHLAEHRDLRSVMSEKIRTLHKLDSDVAVAKILLAVSHDHGAVP